MTLDNQSRHKTKYN